MSHLIRRLQRDGRPPYFDVERWEREASATPLPTPAEQADNVLLYIRDNYPIPGQHIELRPVPHQAIMGAFNSENFVWVLSHLADQGLITLDLTMGPQADVQVTFAGWLRIEELTRQQVTTRKAFMAMKYGDGQLDAVFAGCFKPAVAEAGFDLHRLDEDPAAGLIDDRLRVEIRTSRFLVADLTHANLGAYWESGFAEGIGRPVIYTCRRDYFEEHGTHFDTSHFQTVLWMLDDLPRAAAGLKATIRATLPSEAKLED
jgi:hypothetical protein